MKIVKIIISMVFVVAVMGCGSDDDDCDDDIAGCPSDYYSCPEADMCYSTKSGCSSSGECD